MAAIQALKNMIDHNVRNAFTTTKMSNTKPRFRGFVLVNILIRNETANHTRAFSRRNVLAPRGSLYTNSHVFKLMHPSPTS